MDISVFKPQMDSSERYAIAVPAEGGIVVPFKSYGTLEQLREGYKGWCLEKDAEDI